MLPSWWFSLDYRRPIFLDIPHEPSRPAAWFTFDLWHCLHLGMGKVLCASAFALMSDRMSASNVVDRFSELSDLYMQWCDETRTPPFITSINKELIGWPDRSTFPNGYWSKGHITVTFMKFILFWLNNNDVSDCRMLTICRQAMSLLCEALEELYWESLWLDQDTARRIGEKGMKFMELYGKLVRIAYRNGQALWALMPKSHVVHHIFLWNARKHVVQWFHRLRMRFRLVKISLERSLALREGWDRSRWFSVCLNALWWSCASVGLKPISWAAESKKRWSIAGSTGMGNADGMHHNFKRLNKY